MAKRRINPSISDITGKIGDLIHYTRKGKPLTRSAPVRAKPFTESELKNQSRFRQAQIFARSALKVPLQRARYEKAAVGLDASGYNMAVSDFFHAPVVAELDLSGYTGRTGEGIRIQADEGRIGAVEVQVRIVDGAEAVVEEGIASRETDGVTWWYMAQRDLEPNQRLSITVTAIDQPGNRTTKTVPHITGL